MKEFEPAKREYESTPLPAGLDGAVRAGIRQGKLRRRARRVVRRSAATLAACFTLLLLSLNLSPTFAQAAAGVPVVGGLCRVLTVNQFESYEDQVRYQVNVPAVQDDGALAQQVNAHIQQRMDAHLAECKQIWEEYHVAFLASGGTEEEWSEREMDVVVDYEIKSQSDTTVSFVVNQFVGTFNAYNEQYFYNLNLAENRDITLQDLLGDNWVERCNAVIEAQIAASVDADGFTYFFSQAEGGFTTVDETTDFYINAVGNPVVVFPRYAIAAGAAGATEFPISR